MKNRILKIGFLAILALFGIFFTLPRLFDNYDGSHKLAVRILSKKPLDGSHISWCPVVIEEKGDAKGKSEGIPAEMFRPVALDEQERVTVSIWFGGHEAKFGILSFLNTYSQVRKIALKVVYRDGSSSLNMLAIPDLRGDKKRQIDIAI